MKDKNTAVKEFWDNYISANPSKVTQVLPESLYQESPSLRKKRTEVIVANISESYKAAALECSNKVKKIAAECRVKNEKFTDEEFLLEEIAFCVKGLKFAVPIESDDNENDDSSEASDDSSDSIPNGSVHRVGWIFEKPAFTIDGFSKSDIKQGRLGDCWFLAALSCVSSQPKLLEKVCVARDEEVGVYGFVFFRDGEWVSVVIDDFLYVDVSDYEEWYSFCFHEKEEAYKKTKQTGSSALYYGHCTDPNETWVPLIEKAYAKLHGDYEAIIGGWANQGIVDLTGGSATDIWTNNILSLDTHWKELLEVNEKFLFSAGFKYIKGLISGHSYAILKAVEAEDEKGNTTRFVLVRNPWGDSEWTGRWSDGSKEWSPYWMDKLGHRFGDDGEFWMQYEDLMHYCRDFHRTRLYDETWSIAQKWTSVKVPWMDVYLPTKFLVEISKAGTVVFMLTQLDDRYFRGLQGRYSFATSYVVRKKGAELDDNILSVPLFQTLNFRAQSSGEVHIEPGQYEVLIKIYAWEKDNVEPLDLIRSAIENAPDKLKQIGSNYDYAHSILENDDQEHEKVETEDDGKKVETKKESEKVDAKIDSESEKVETEEDGEEAECEEDGEEAECEEDCEEDESEEESKKKIWDPVAVVGLRVLAQVSSINIQVVNK